LKEFGYEFSGGQANATFSSFGWIKKNAVLFGFGNMAVAFGAVLFVVIAARRSRPQLSDALARLDERTRELAGSVSLINATLESTPDGVMAVDRTGKIRAYNQNFVSMWGLQTYLVDTRSSETIIALCSVQTKDPGDFVDRIETLRAAPETEHSDLVEFQDGRIVEQVAIPQWVGDECIGTVLNFRDITHRKRAEAELAYERDLLRSLLDHSPDHIYFKDRNSRFIKCSSRLAERFGLKDPNEVGGKTDFDFFAENHARPAFEDEQAIIRTGQPVIGKVEKETWQNSETSNWVLTSKMPLRSKAGEIIGTFGISKDISAIKQAETELERVHRQLMDASRNAGMAEVATSVLHNVGNVLNSVNVSTSVILDRLGKSKISNVTRLAALLGEHLHDLSAFVTTDPAGRQLPAYIARLAERLAAERSALVEEAKQLQKNVDHIKEIVAMQQNYAKMGAVVENISAAELIEDALRMNAGALTRHEVEVVREYES
jgi:PAS domain S-box-containing protein